MLLTELVVYFVSSLLQTKTCSTVLEQVFDVKKVAAGGTGSPDSACATYMPFNLNLSFLVL